MFHKRSPQNTETYTTNISSIKKKFPQPISMVVLLSFFLLLLLLMRLMLVAIILFIHIRFCNCWNRNKPIMIWRFFSVVISSPSFGFAAAKCKPYRWICFVNARWENERKRTVVLINQIFSFSVPIAFLCATSQLARKNEKSVVRRRLIELSVCRSTMLNTIVDLVYDISREAIEKHYCTHKEFGYSKKSTPTYSVGVAHVPSIWSSQTTSLSQFMSEATYFISTSGHPSHTYTEKKKKINWTESIHGARML